MTPEFSTSVLTKAVRAALISMSVAASVAAHADPTDMSAGDAQVITITSVKDAKAAETSPSQVSLDAIQPQSIVGQHAIEENAFAGSNYADIVNWTPSVFSVDPNGSGLMESQSLTIRGFQDGQYNVTFDGIPWGDSNDFTHHSTVYFMPQDMGRISVDRGPGDAGTIGNATFGGTIAINSKDTTAAHQGLVYGSYGSWATGLLGAEYNTGTLSNFGDSRIYVSLKGLDSNGFLTQSGQRRENVFVKMDTPLSSATTLTFVAMYNHTLQHVPNGSTPEQQAQYGYNFGLVDNSQSEANSPWNYDWLSTDFEYVGLKTKVDTWTIDNKLYTYAYYHYGYYGMNTGSVTAAQTVSDGGTTFAPTDVPGIRMHNNYRSVGDLFRASDRLGPGVLETGLWFDYQRDNRFQQDIDWTLGGIPYPGESNGGSVQRSMANTLTTFQPYVQYTWNVTSEFSVTPGVKYDSFRRTIDAPVNQGTEVPYSGSATWNKTLPSVIARYTPTSNVTLYAQYAQGFLAPNLNVFYKSSPDLASVQPTTTKNYQIGANFVAADLVLGGDIYHIDSTNIASATACPAGFTACAQLVPGVKFDGVELEATYKVAAGVSLYGNIARNNYTTSDGSVLQNTPKSNGVLGVIYQAGSLYASLLDKYVGPRWSNVDASGNNLYLPGYALADLDVSYKFADWKPFGVGGTKLSFKVGNVFNREENYASLFSDIKGNPLYYVIPSRNYQASVAVPF